MADGTNNTVRFALVYIALERLCALEHLLCYIESAVYISSSIYSTPDSFANFNQNSVSSLTGIFQYTS